MNPHDDPGAALPPDELTPAERAAFAALPRERAPGALLEERTLRALRERGTLSAPAWPRFRLPPSWAAAAVAAGVALFAGGIAVGQWMGARSTERVVAAVQAQNARQAALLVQQTGSAYVAALSNLAQVADTAKGAADAQGREVAVQMFRAVADEVVRIAPDDPVASGILASFDRAQQGQPSPGQAEGKRRLVWF